MKTLNQDHIQVYQQFFYSIGLSNHLLEVNETMLNSFHILIKNYINDDWLPGNCIDNVKLYETFTAITTQEKNYTQVRLVNNKWYSDELHEYVDVLLYTKSEHNPDFSSNINFSNFYIVESYQNVLIISRNNKQGIISRNGTIILPTEFDFIVRFDYETFMCSKNDKFGFFNEHGKELISCIYDNAFYHKDDKEFLVYLNNESKLIKRI